MRYYFTYKTDNGQDGYGFTSSNILNEVILKQFIKDKSEEWKAEICLTFIQKLED